MAKQKRGQTPHIQTTDESPLVEETSTVEEPVDVVEQPEDDVSVMVDEPVELTDGEEEEILTPDVEDETPTELVEEPVAPEETTELDEEDEEPTELVEDEEAIADLEEPVATESVNTEEELPFELTKVKDILKEAGVLSVSLLANIPKLYLAQWARDNLKLFKDCKWNLQVINGVLKSYQSDLKNIEDITIEDTLNAILDSKPVPKFRSALINSHTRYENIIASNKLQDLTLDEISGMLLGVIRPDIKIYLDEDKLFKSSIGKNIVELVKTKIKATRPALRDVLDWTDADLRVYVAEGVEPKRHKGVLINSVKRNNMLPQNWTVSDINLWLEDMIDTPVDFPEEYLLARAIRLHKLHYSYGRNSVKRYVRTGLKLKPNSMGVYSDDRFRAASDPRTWSIPELISFLQGYFKMPEDKVPAVYQAIRERFAIDEGHSEEFIKDKLISLNTVEVPMPTRIMKDTLEEFVKTIESADAHGPEVVGRVHAQLQKVIQNTLALPTAEFYTAWGEILRVALANRDSAFSEYRAFTFVEHANVSAANANMYNLALTAIINTCDPITRPNNTRCVNVEGITGGMIIGRAQAEENLTNFYKL